MAYSGKTEESRQLKLAYRKRQRERRKEAINAAKRRYRSKNRDKINAAQRERRNLNKEEVAARRKLNRQANPEAYKAMVKRTVDKNRAHINEHARLKAREFRKTDAYKVKKKLELERFHRKRELLAGRPKPVKCEMINCDKTDVVYDHCHATNSFRGWPCNHCNVILGLAGDNPDLLRELADYLERFAASPMREAA